MSYGPFYLGHFFFYFLSFSQVLLFQQLSELTGMEKNHFLQIFCLKFKIKKRKSKVSSGIRTHDLVVTANTQLLKQLSYQAIALNLGEY